MNPFCEDSSFDPRLYEVICKIRKKGGKTKLEGLKELEGFLETLDVNGDIDMVVEVIEECIVSEDVQIRTQSIDILYKLLCIVPDRKQLAKVVSVWLYGFVENPNYAVSRRIFCEFVNIEELEDEFVKQLDFKENVTLSLLCLLLLIKRGKKDYRGVFEENVKHLRLSSNKELEEVYRICSVLGAVDALYERVVCIKGHALMNIKWRILLDVFKSVPECLVDDARHLDHEILTRALSGREWCDDVMVKSVDSLRVVKGRIKDINGYLSRYLRGGMIDGLCVFEFTDDIGFIDESVEFKVANRVIGNVIRMHFENQDMMAWFYEVQDETHVICEDVSECKEHNNHVHMVNDRLKMARMIAKSMKGLDGWKRIVRADTIRMKLEPCEFSNEDVEKVFEQSVNVFPKHYMLESEFGCDVFPLVMKYADEVSELMIKRAVNKNNMHLFIKRCKDLGLIRQLMDGMSDRDILDMYLMSEVPMELDIDFYYRIGGRMGIPRMVEYDEVVKRYLNGGFIMNAIDAGVIDRRLLYDAVVRCISQIELPMSTAYTNEFYDIDECFYKDVRIREENGMIRKLRKVYVDIYENTLEMFLLLVIDSMSGDEPDELDEMLRSKRTSGREELIAELQNDASWVERIREIDVGANMHFVEKVFFELGMNSRRCVERPVNELLMNGGMRGVDYVLRKCRFPLQIVPFLDFSYLSNEGLRNVVASLVMNKNGSHVDLTGEWGGVEKHRVPDEVLELLIKPGFQGTIRIRSALIIEMIEKDVVMKMKPYEKKRRAIYNELLKGVYEEVSESIINMYSISRVETESVDDEVYEVLKGCLLGSKILFWDLLLNSLIGVRSININVFFEKMVREKEEWREFVNKADVGQRSLFAFVFPNLFAEIPRMDVALDDLILKEASRNIAGVTVRMHKLSNGFNVKIMYTAGDMCFSALIVIPVDYPHGKAVFSSEMDRKSLLNLKINELMRRCSKFMELVCLWKINIDEKVSGHEECPICYFVIDMHDSSFPNSQCSGCKSKFHSRCITKWIANGVRSSCPMCRKPMENVESKTAAFTARIW
ncbi:hypothetical protein CWI42_011410 [Ordospora colligata]|uniref:E3 ubiquitin-protein ligase listerin n=1 Tax=Ordospora colligata OC4 TaxID=1354746 RepID=A0A0B2UN40_9MICR|nr:uncharacterized protein M896_011410 [Ordospora colligata OC4]KHN70487.1 hypothetical protein M896_011410 [Ordospora colligata OC4]TBU17237.1 hypothetical protein CWI41_011410 [Ordospora colligata]TBU17487.1 hypothetical protein CWI40_011410 [Ordospora colligata]TBU19667.1 hypothetical protein CWI42_011410 [Ordospora colligata]